MALQLEDATLVEAAPEIQGELTALLATILSLPRSAMTLDVLKLERVSCAQARGAESLAMQDSLVDSLALNSAMTSVVTGPVSVAATPASQSIMSGAAPVELGGMQKGTWYQDDSAQHYRVDGTGQGFTTHLLPPSVAVPPTTVYVVASGGNDSRPCGAMDSPCATLRHAVNVVANAVTPLTIVVPVVLGPGQYGPGSCGANATRAMNISGSGSDATRIDCQGTGQALVASDSLWLTGLTITGGAASVSVVVPENLQLPFAAGGGGGVAVAWPTTLNNLSLDLQDVMFMNNSVAGLVQGAVDGDQTCFLGGGGLYVAGGGNGTEVSIRNCSFVENAVSVRDYTGMPSLCGGGLCVLAGLSSTPSQQEGASLLTNVVLTVSGVHASSNSQDCLSGCYYGACTYEMGSPHDSVLFQVTNSAPYLYGYVGGYNSGGGVFLGIVGVVDTTASAIVTVSNLTAISNKAVEGACTCLLTPATGSRLFTVRVIGWTTCRWGWGVHYHR